MLEQGTAVCWKTTATGASLRGKIVAVVGVGRSPVEVCPELARAKFTQVKFSDRFSPRAYTNYLISREERSDHGTERTTYYLRRVERVEAVRECGRRR